MKVLIADDQALVRSGFALVLSIEEDIEVVGQAANGSEAVRMVEETGAEVVLMDVQMPVMDGIAATEEIVRRDLAKVVILTTFDREDYLFDALAAGASGFLLKNAEPEDLVEAIRAVAHGHALLAPEVTMRVIQRFARSGASTGSTGAPAGRPPSPAVAPAGDLAPSELGTPAATGPDHDAAAAIALLTAREREVLGLMATGLSNSEIAKRLFLGESTVKTHVSNVLSKTGSRDRVQAVVLAHQAGVHTAGAMTQPGTRSPAPPQG